MHEWADNPSVMFTYFDETHTYAVESSYHFAGNALAQLRKWLKADGLTDPSLPRQT